MTRADRYAMQLGLPPTSGPAPGEIARMLVHVRDWVSLRDAVREYIAACDAESDIPVLSPGYADAWTKVDDARERLRELVK